MDATALVLFAVIAVLACIAWAVSLLKKKAVLAVSSDKGGSPSVGTSQARETVPRNMDTESPHERPASHSVARVMGKGGEPGLAIHDLVDIHILQQVIDVFVRATGLASVVVDLKGAPLTSIDNFSDFCMKHTRGTEEGSKRCEANDAKGGAEATRTGKPVVYYCHAGLIDFAVPIIVNGRQIGTWLGGQILTAKPDEKKFRKIAREIGVDEDEYIKDLRKIKIIPKNQIDGLADLLSLIANTLVQIAYARKVTEEKAAELSERMMHAVSKLISGLRDISEPAKKLEGMTQHATAALHETADRAGSGQTDLALMESTMRTMEEASRVISGKLQMINEKSQDISGIVGTITKVANQTNLLSLNAAIEAEKAGEYGRGFTVVAREIRRLADQTAVSILGIEQMVKEMQMVVSSGVKETDNFIAEVRSSANDVVKIGGQLTQIIEQVQVLLPRFEEVGAAVNHQTERTYELHQSMAQLSKEMQDAIESMRRSFSATDRLK